MQLLAFFVLQTSHVLHDGRELIGIVAAVLAAILAANLSWTLTDRVLARRSARRSLD